LARDQFHHQRENPVRLLQAVEVRDVRMVQGGEDLGFALKPRKAVRIRRPGLQQDLDRDLAFQAEISGAVNLAHPAGTEGADDLVGPEECAGSQRQPTWIIRASALLARARGANGLDSKSGSMPDEILVPPEHTPVSPRA
jgi:hypothetical protein